jgi:8-oxo-dGTP pyrophosphatase MutT (NUDIX family)
MSVLRDAASLILLKPAGQSWRILMGLRHANHKFLPNHMVFPGGGVDQEDFSAPIAAPLRTETLADLCKSATPELAAALGHAAARELEEETGLSLGHPPALDGLAYLCRAETPADRPIRFNARFFVADAALAAGTLAGSGELESLDWYELDAILKLDLALATRVVLGQLQTWLALDEPGRARRKIPVLRDRAWGEE